MEMDNRIMLITYADSLGGDLPALHRTLNRYFRDAVGSVHVLPFFPSSADRGFAPMRYDRVDPAFGTFEDIRALSGDYPLMFDFMVNHISSESPYYKDFLQQKDASPYRDFFIRYSDFWENGTPTREQMDKIYKRKPREPYVEAQFADGTAEKLWCTFGNEQIDLDVRKPATRAFIRDTLLAMCGEGAALIRLDAFAYTVKKAGTSCFFVEPEVWELLGWIRDIVAPHGVSILPEVHEHYTIQMKLAEHGYWIYDFALPVLTLHALYAHDGQYLQSWLERSPKKQFTTLDTHDGIGIVDVKDLLPDAEIEFTRARMYEKGANVKKIYSSAAYNNLDIYQMNTTYYSALGNHDAMYLAARAIQFFARGIPQVYYVGLLAGQNDVKLMEETKNGRDINRHSYTEAEVEREAERPVVKELMALMKLRNGHPAFAVEGELEAELPQPDTLRIKRTYGAHWAVLTVNLTDYTYHIEHS
ncbi:MAG: sucrose phosphorylase [Eubacteriales bacterium]|nr:sucrose phosphorylase [Eubacteriales bacterium]